MPPKPELGLEALLADGVIPGIGVDLESVERWRDPGLRLHSLFSEYELAHCRDRHDVAVHLAGLWCAKEAAFKALAPWLAEGSAPSIGLRDITIGHDERGAPIVQLRRPWSGTIRVSITHTPTLALAVAVAAPRTHQDRSSATES